MRYYIYICIAVALVLIYIGCRQYEEPKVASFCPQTAATLTLCIEKEDHP